MDRMKLLGVARRYNLLCVGYSKVVLWLLRYITVPMLLIPAGFSKLSYSYTWKVSYSSFLPCSGLNPRLWKSSATICIHSVHSWRSSQMQLALSLLNYLSFWPPFLLLSRSFLKLLAQNIVHLCWIMLFPDLFLGTFIKYLLCSPVRILQQTVPGMPGCRFVHLSFGLPKLLTKACCLTWRWVNPFPFFQITESERKA